MFMTYYFMFLMGMCVFCSKQKHFLITLLSIEFMVLALFIMITSAFDSSFWFFSLIFLTFSACEGALGLSIMIFMARSYGADFTNMFSFME